MADRKTAVVTGSSGFLGRHTVEALRAAGWRVLTSGRSQLAGRLPDVPLDISRPQDVIPSLECVDFDAIIHLAAKIEWQTNVEGELFASNVLATGCIAEVATRKKAKLVVSSSVAVHGACINSITPASMEIADTPYGVSKLLGDKLVQASGARHCIIRFGGLFGLGGPGHLGLNRAVSGILAGEPPVIVGSGLARRNYLYVKDAAEAVVSALEDDVGGIHLCAGHETLSIGEMLHAACDTLAPGLQPLHREGSEAADQIIEPSSALPRSRSFTAALRDIASDAVRCG